jgi:hypothetical protein
MDYDFELVHITGAKNGCADALSRCPDYNQGEEDNKKLVVLPEGLFQRAYARLAGSDEADPSEAHSWQRMTKGLDNGKYGSLQERIVKEQQKEASKKKISCWTNTYQMTKEHEVWWKGDWIVIAGDNDLKWGVIHYFHDTPSAGHPGITNTYNLAKCDTWWPYMKQDVEQYCYGRLAVVSNLDDGGFALNVDKELRGSAVL